MDVSQIMNTKVQACSSSETAARAAQIMWDNDCGAVPVIDERSQVKGIVTDRDLCMAAYTTGRPLHEIPVMSAMSRELFTVTPRDPLSAVQRLMREKQIRRLPVIEAGRLVGVISLSDIARRAGSSGTRGDSELSAARITETLGAISEPHAPAQSVASG